VEGWVSMHVDLAKHRARRRSSARVQVRKGQAGERQFQLVIQTLLIGIVVTPGLEGLSTLDSVRRKAEVDSARPDPQGMTLRRPGCRSDI